MEVTLNGKRLIAKEGQTAIELMNENNVEVPSLCYHPSLGAIETCDTCIVNINGELVRSCSTELKDGDVITTHDEESHEAQLLAIDRVLGNHQLYCTICDYNNGNCEIHNTVKEMKIKHQKTP